MAISIHWDLVDLAAASQSPCNPMEANNELSFSGSFPESWHPLHGANGKCNFVMYAFELVEYLEFQYRAWYFDNESCAVDFLEGQLPVEWYNLSSPQDVWPEMFCVFRRKTRC